MFVHVTGYSCIICLKSTNVPDCDRKTNKNSTSYDVRKILAKTDSRIDYTANTGFLPCQDRVHRERVAVRYNDESRCIASYQHPRQSCVVVDIEKDDRVCDSPALYPMDAHFPRRKKDGR
jgi:hypothetical protein